VIQPVTAHSLWTGPRQDPRRYRVELKNGTLHAIGDGGEGLVYRATRVSGGAPVEVALKMHTTLAMADFEKLQERAQTLRTVDHGNVMHLVDVFVGTALIDTDTPSDDDFSVIYTVAEWIPGAPLGVARSTLGPVRGMRWVSELARAVAYLHSFRSADAPDGIVHRDIKPSNVRITPAGRAVLIDFGVARPHVDDDMTHGAGTYLWQAPEVVGGPGAPGPASDAWGIGALAFWMLDGQPPRLDDAGAGRAHIEAMARNEGFADPVGLGRHVARLLESHPGQRPRDLNRWADDLDVIVAGDRPHRWSSAAVESLIRHSRLVIGALSLIVILAVVVTTSAVYIGRRNAQNLAQAGELASESVNTLQTDLKLGSLLSVESSRLAATTQTHDAVVDALEQPVDAVFNAGRPIADVTLSPTGRILAENTGNEIVLWDTASRKEIRRFRADRAVSHVAFSPSGAILAAAEGDHVVLWQTGSGQEIGRPIPAGHVVTGIAFRPGDSVLAVAAGTRVTMWNPTTQTMAGPTVTNQVNVTSVAFSRSGTLATGDSAGTVDVWDTASGRRTAAFPDVGGTAVTSMAFSPDATTLAVVAQTDYIVLLNTATQQKIGKSLPDGNRVTSVAFNPQLQGGATVLESGTSGGNVVEWTITDAGTSSPDEVFQTLGDGSDVTSVAFNADGSRLAVGDLAGDATVWNMQTPIGFSASADEVVKSVAFNPDGTTFATGSSGGSVTLWKAARLSEAGPSLSNVGAVSGIAFSPDGTTVAVASDRPSVTLWNAGDTAAPRHLAVPSRAYGVAFSPDGQMVASGDAGGEIRVWRTVPRVHVVATLKGHVSVRSVAFSADGKTLAAGDDKGMVVLWDIATGQPVGRISDGSKVNSVAFSPDGSYLATGDDAGNVEVWSVNSLKEVASFDDRSSVYSIAFSPNGRTLATGDALGDIIPWDIASGTEIGPSLVDGNAVESIAFSPDGGTLLSGDDAGNVFLFPASFLSATTSTIVEQLCNRIGGNLTPTQWAQYLPHMPYQKVCPANP
jgi:WD40 repeat protein/serine/threonine protein kinase